MRYKMVAIDVDGTLLNNNHQIPIENVQTIRELKEKGVHFVIVTGRPDASVKEYVEILGIDAPILGCNGATIRNIFTNELHVLKSIDTEALKQLQEYFAAKNLYPRFYGLDSVFTLNPYEFEEDKNPFAKFSKRLNSIMPFKVVNSIQDIISNQIQITKIVYIDNNPENILTVQDEIRKIKGIEAYRVGSISLDIVTSGVSKGQALLDYAASLNISKNEIIAIGDSENDLSMLEAVGYPVTLENGEDALKKMARLITDSNENSGVAKALKTIYEYNEEEGKYNGI